MNEVILTPIQQKKIKKEKKSVSRCFFITLQLTLPGNLNIDDLNHLFISFYIYNMNIFNLTLKKNIFI